MNQLVNKENNQVILTEVTMANSIWKRFVGLMGREQLSEDSGLLLRPCNSIHTFFMKFPIDVVFVDKNDVVLKTITAMQPNRISPIVKKSAYVIEGNANTLGQQLVEGNRIKLVESPTRKE